MIKRLFYKPTRYEPVIPADSLTLSPDGIAGSIHAEPMRHVLIVPQSTLDEFGLTPGDLRENVVIDDSSFGGLHELPSGTVLGLGDVDIRLTIHCEPCPRMNPVVSDYRVLKDKRGYLGTITKGGTIKLGDLVVPKGVRYEAIPFDLKERILWYLDKQDSPVPVTTLVKEVGLSVSYCRVIPNVLRDLPKAKAKVLFAKDQAPT
ncbi:MAG: MOSC domain-containing protein [Vicinamibacterales bacterium]